jgi:hypothetical protein
VPAFTEVVPEYVFTPLNASTPSPVFTSEPADVPFAITPPKAPAPTVNTVPFNVTVPVPPPFKTANVTANGESTTEPSAANSTDPSSPAPDATVSAAPEATATSPETNRPVPLNANVPALTVVDPVNVFTPLNVSVPTPCFTNEPAANPSRITPSKTPLLKVNAVPFSVTRPVEPPSNANNSAADADNANTPSTVNAAPVDKAASAETVT